ncbi:MAG: hypothetical protein ACO1NQ_05405, partial [Flavobacteriales bacterium]
NEKPAVPSALTAFDRRRERDCPKRAFPGGGGFVQQPCAHFVATGFFILPLARSAFGSLENEKAAVPCGTDGY